MPQPLQNPPPGFETLSVDEKIDYVESLWDSIAESVEATPVPDWHREVIRERLSEHHADPDAGRSWEEVRQELERKYLSRQ
jgi:putative addiction module component (TIGR02574 family)